MDSATDLSGQAGQKDMVGCIACDKKLHISASACPHCGASQRSGRYKSKTVAALFALLLGGFGAHRFYLGQWWGVFYLLFFWLWIPGLIAFVEFIVFLASDSKKWDAKYNEGKPSGTGDSGAGVAIVIGVVFGAFFLVAIVGILAAIALPAYQDYSVRANVNSALLQAQPVKQKVEEFHSTHGLFASGNIMLGLDEPYFLEGKHEVTVKEAGIELRLHSDVDAINNQTLILTPSLVDGYVSWDCTRGTLTERHRPRLCGLE